MAVNPIITRGYGDNSLIITRGYGALREVISAIVSAPILVFKRIVRKG